MIAQYCVPGNLKRMLVVYFLKAYLPEWVMGAFYAILIKIISGRDDKLGI